jgi:hypothetical protein
MNDDVIERELRAWFETHAEPDVPASLSRFLGELPRTHAGVHRVERRSPILAAPRRDLALVLVAAVVAVALGASLIAGGLLKSVQPSGSPSSSGVPASPGAAGPYRWTLVSSKGEASTYSVGPVLRRADGSLLAIGFGQQARVLSSTDGRAWTVEPADPGLLRASANHLSLVTGLADSGGQLVAVGATALDDISSGDARAWTSTDGVRWQAVPSSAGMLDAEMESVTAGPDGFVAVGSDGFPGGNTQLPGARGAAVWLSSDGRTWTRAPSQTSFEGAVMFGVAHTSSGYVAWGEIHDPGGSGPSLPPIWTSSDGLHWDRASGIGDAGGPGNPIASVVAMGDRLVAVGSRQLPESADGIVVPAAWQSDDGGHSWTLASSPDASGAAPRAGGLRDVAQSGSDLVAVGHLELPSGQTGPLSAIAWRSTDQGASWVALPDEPSFAGSIMDRVVGIGGGFVAFGSADDPNALSNPNLVWLAEPPPAPVPTTVAAPETIRYAGFGDGDGDVGWAVTDRRLVLTDDGGATWRTAGPPIDYASGAPKGASFFDADHGWLVSEDSFTSSLSLWRTADGGASWTRSMLPAVPNSPETMGDARTFWIDATHAVIDVEGGMPNGFIDGLLFTADAGRTWTEPTMRSVTQGADGITGLPSFLDPQIGWLAGGAPGTRLWATRDGGATWNLQPLAVPAGYLDDQGSFWGAPTFFNRNDGVAARTFDNNQSTVLVIYRTSDGGRTWQPVRNAAPDSASSWSFPSQAEWILWDPYHTTMWRSTDQGTSWTRGSTTGLPGDAAPVMTDDLHGWAISINTGASGLYVTGDGGRTWTAIDPLTAPPSEPTGTLGPAPSVPPTQLTLKGAFEATIAGMGDPGMCGASSGIVVISPEAVGLGQAQFVRVGIWVPMALGAYPAASLIAPNGTASVQAALLTNPAGGGGEAPWVAIDGTVRVTEITGFGQPGRYGLAAGTVEATLRRVGSPDLRISGQWGCVSG